MNVSKVSGESTGQEKAGGKSRFSLAGLVKNNLLFGLIIAALLVLSLQGCYIYHHDGGGHGQSGGGYERQTHYDRHHR